MKLNPALKFGFALLLLTSVNLIVFSSSKKGKAVIGSVSIHEERISLGGQGLLPSEFDPHLYRSISNIHRGTLISVGSILKTDFSSGKFSRVILLDEDTDVVEFNRVVLDLIKILGKIEGTSLQRYHFLSLLTHRRFLSAQETKQVRSEFTTEGERVQFILDLPSGTEGVLPKTDLAHRNMKPVEVLSKVLDRVYGSPEQSSESLRFIISELGKNENRLEVVLWGSDQAWTETQKLIAENEINIVNGNFSGANSQGTFATLAAALKEKNETVSAIDLSSLPQNLLMVDSKDSSPEKRAQLVANLNILPLSADAAILFTLPYFSVEAASAELMAVTELMKMRIYFALSKSNFIRGALLVPTSNVDGFRGYVANLAKIGKSELVRRPIVIAVD